MTFGPYDTLEQANEAYERLRAQSAVDAEGYSQLCITALDREDPRLMRCTCTIM